MDKIELMNLLIKIGIATIIATIIIAILYNALAKPILEELKEIKEKLTQLTQKEEEKSKDE